MKSYALSYVNYEKLFQLCGNPIVTGVMPLPNSIQFEGLATGLYKNFDKSDTLLKMTYVRGGKKRLELLLNGMADFIICSRMTAEKAIEVYPRKICLILEHTCNLWCVTPWTFRTESFASKNWGIPERIGSWSDLWPGANLKNNIQNLSVWGSFIKKRKDF